MAESDEIYNNLRKKLDIMGYTQMLPLTGVPLVGVLFQDLVRTTQSLRDAKKEIIELLDSNEHIKPNSVDGECNCCKETGKALAEEKEKLLHEKMDILSKIREYQQKMHESMQQALEMQKMYANLEKDFDDLKLAALVVESQANEEFRRNEKKIMAMQIEIDKLMSQNDQTVVAGAKERETNYKQIKVNQHLNKKLHKLKHKIDCMHNKIHKNNLINQEHPPRTQEGQTTAMSDDDKERLRSERDYFQKEYLNFMKVEKQNEELLRRLIESKDEELQRMQQMLRREQHFPQATCTAHCDSARSQAACTIHCDSTRSQECYSPSAMNSAASSRAAIIRAKRDRDCALEQVERLCCEKDTLMQEHLNENRKNMEKIDYLNQLVGDLKAKLENAESETHHFKLERLESESHVKCLKDELEDYKSRLSKLEADYTAMEKNYNDLKVLGEQNEMHLMECQTKLLLAERKLKSNCDHLNEVNTNYEETSQEVCALKTKIQSLKRTYVELEQEKDDLLQQLDTKTQKLLTTEEELRKVKEQYSKKAIQPESHKRHDGSGDSSDRNLLHYYKGNMDEMMKEKKRLSKELDESLAEVVTLKEKLRDATQEVEQLKQQLSQYVQEVRKAEDLLMYKEKEREEMLEHYRSLSHDAVVLETNNQSLEVEAAEYRRKASDLEGEVATLKAELRNSNQAVERLEDRIGELISKNNCLENQLEEALCEQRLLRVDLNARKELCDKLDIQKDKLNAELYELNEIKRKLERDSEQLKLQLKRSVGSSSVSSTVLEELLTKTRSDLEQQLKADNELAGEIKRLRMQNNDLLEALERERQRRANQEILASEYQVQNNELRQNLTDERFRGARVHEESSSITMQNTF